MKFNKKKFAKEWIVFIGGLFFAFLLPLLIILIIAIIKGKFLPAGELYEIIFEAMFNGDIGVYILILLPYILIQFIRSIVWSIKTIKSKK